MRLLKFMLFLFLTTVVMEVKAQESYARFDETGTKITFYYDEFYGDGDDEPFENYVLFYLESDVVTTQHPMA